MTTRATEDGTVRDDPPVPSDWALVVRPLGGPGSGFSDLANGTEFPIGAVAVMVMAANPNAPQTTGARVTAVVQNVGPNNVRVGVAGVTSTTGLRLIPNASIIFDEPDVYNGEIWVIEEAAGSTVIAMEAVLP